jgi:hypothetical protein
MKRIEEEINTYLRITTKAEEEHTTRIDTLTDWKGWIGYLYKEKTHKPTIYGNTTPGLIENIPKYSEAYDKKRQKREIQACAVRNGQEWIPRVIKFMNDKEYKVNSSTRMIMPDHETFFRELETELCFYRTAGKTAFTELETMISNPNIHVLPEYKPNRNVISFKDGYYIVSDGLFYEYNNKNNENKTQKQVRDELQPVYHTDTEFNSHRVLPVKWIESIKYQEWSGKAFIRDYGALYKKKQRKRKALAIYGPSQTGKSTFMEPFEVLFDPIIRSITNDGNFSFQSLSKCEIIKQTEFKLSQFKGALINDLKKILEGDKVEVAVKNSSSTYIEPKTTYILSNDDPDDLKHLARVDKDIEAIFERFALHVATKKHSYKDKTLNLDYIDDIREEAIAVMLVCTQKHEYIPQKDIEEAFGKYWYDTGKYWKALMQEIRDIREKTIRPHITFIE